MKEAMFRIGLAFLVVIGASLGIIQGCKNPASPRLVQSVQFAAKGFVVGQSEGAQGELITFKADDGLTILVPLRGGTAKAIPLSADAQDFTRQEIKKACFVFNRLICDEYETKTTHIPAEIHHGVLRYHECGSNLYCFESWEDVK